MKKNKQEVITFKADESLLEALRGMPNRSEFIRNAILSSLDKICPTCKGTGTILGSSEGHQQSAGGTQSTVSGGRSSIVGRESEAF